MLNFVFRTFLISCLSSVSLFCQSQLYEFVSIENLYEQKVGAIVLTEVYRQLGIPMSIQPMPGKRAIAEAVSGRKDGEIMRIWTYGVEHPELIRVPTPYYQLETMGFHKEGSGVSVKVIDDLKSYEIFKVRGVKHTNNITAGLNNVYDYDNTKEMLSALRDDRPAIALTHTGDGIFTMNKYKIFGLSMISEPLAELKLYHYIHHSHRELVNKVDKALLKMKLSGELDKIIRDAEKRVSEGK